MATYQSGTKNTYYAILTVTEDTPTSAQIAANESTLNYKLVLYSGYNNFEGYTIGHQIHINGTRVKYQDNSGNQTSMGAYSEKTVASGSITVPHNADGSKTVAVSFSIWTNDIYYLPVSLSASGTFTCTTIPRASTPTLSASSFNAGGELTIYTNRASSAFTHTLEYSLNDSSGEIATGVGDSYTWKAADTKELANLLPNATSGVMTIYCYTYNGSSHIGTKSINVTVNVPDTSEFLPTVSFTTEDETECLEKYGKYVQGKSTLIVEVTSAGTYGSSISSRSMTFDGRSHTVESDGVAIVDSIKGTGTLTLEVTVKDSRGRTASASATVQVYPYEAPKITDMVIRRSNQDGTSNSSGEHLAVDFSTLISSLEGKNSVNYSLLYKKMGDADFTEQALTGWTDNYWVEGATVTFAADTAFSYDVLLVVEDDFYQGDEAISKAGLGSSIEVVWSRAAKGLGFAFGKVAEYIASLGKRLEVNWNARFYKNVEIDGDVVIKGKLSLGSEEPDEPAEYADYVVEEGTVGIWKYQKWASGYVEYYGLLETTVALNIKWGPLYYGSFIQAQELPFPLKEVFFSDAIIRFNNGWTGYSGQKTSPSLTASETVYPIGPVELASEDCFVEYTVKGIIDNGDSQDMSAAWDENGNVTIYGATATHDGAGNVTIY